MNQAHIDNMEVGDYLHDREYVLQKIGDDTFLIDCRISGYKHMCDGQTVMSIIGNLSGMFNGTSATTSSSAITWPPNITAVTLPQITSAEKAELDNLEKELQTHIKMNRLKKFQLLPKHIRQEIVDEAYIRDFLATMNEDHNHSFQDTARLQELRNKRDMSNHGYYVPQITLSSLTAGYSYPVSMGGKYGTILAAFNTKELAEAHAQASLEESLD